MVEILADGGSHWVYYVFHTIRPKINSRFKTISDLVQWCADLRIESSPLCAKKGGVAWKLSRVYKIMSILGLRKFDPTVFFFVWSESILNHRW